MKRVGLGLLLSAVLHAGALLTAAGVSREQPSPAAASTPPLELVRIDVLGPRPGTPAPVAAAAEPPPAAPAPVRAARSRPRAPRVSAATTEAAAPEPAPLPTDTSPAASAPTATSGSPEGVVDAVSGGGESGITGASARPGGSAHGSGSGTGTGAGTAGTDLDTQQRTRLHARLSEAARECYPPAARRFRLTGEVLLSFCLDGRGGFHTAQLIQASGSDLLDRAALDCVLPKAAPLPGPATCLRVPVQFRQDR